MSNEVFGTAPFSPIASQRELRAQHFLFFRDSGIIEPMAKEEAVEMRFGQPKVPLCSMGFWADAHAPLLHRFEQRALHFGAARLDLSARSRLVKIGPWWVRKSPFAWSENPRADDVRRQQVDGELHPAETQVRWRGRGH